ncbi:MAG TPA: 50S ribosomal protein L9 [Candidatus Paceibacterota bacterium]|nr:50S ribosomal protein L9 [Candidatus Paceibacterota bacterium]
MKVILLKDVENLGKKNDVKNVANGHARNFLIPEKLAIPATEKAMKELTAQQEIEIQKAEQELKVVEEIVSQIDGLEIEVFVKADETGKLFGSMNDVKISQLFKDRGFNIKKSQIKILQPIKEVGEHSVIISFDHGLEAEIKLIIIDEATSKPPQQP